MGYETNETRNQKKRDEEQKKGKKIRSTVLYTVTIKTDKLSGGTYREEQWSKQEVRWMRRNTVCYDGKRETGER